MDQREPNLVRSGLSRMVTNDGVTVEVSIVRLENETEWSLGSGQFVGNLDCLGRPVSER